MQIIIDQNEIEEALENYIYSQIAINEDQEIGIDLKAGRGDNGFSATIEIRAAVSKKTKPVKKPAATRAAKKSDPEPEPEQDNTPDEAPVEDTKDSEDKAPETKADTAPAAEETADAPKEAGPSEASARTSIFSKAG